MKIESIENGVKITVERKENYTLKDLKQNLINKINNQLNNQSYLCCDKEIELLKIILENEKY